jgi:putative membrane protein
MPGFLVRWLVSALSLWIASAVVPGMRIEGVGTLLLASILLGLVNAIIRPLAVLFTLPFTVITLGLFLLVVNAAMLGLVALLLPGFTLSGFLPALLGSILVSLVGSFLSWTIGGKGRYEVMVVRRRD